MGNVHGGEESGTDAQLRVLYELADRTDCAATQILDNALVGIIPTQNPDGREAEQRQNAYFFDMNRDWFARTQPETEGKLELLRQYPGVMHIDAHEMGGNHFFFPPAADPIYHEVTEESVELTDRLFGAAMRAEFDRQHIQYFNDKVFDFFAMVYGDTVPSVAFGSGGMTFEKANFHPIAARTYEQYVAHWVSLSAAATNRERVLLDWHGSWVDALAQGTAGRLQPNRVNDKGNTVQLPVPDIRVRHYFLRADDPEKAAEVQSLVRRLQRMDVAVYRLTSPLSVPDFTPYGRTAAASVLPSGTYWVPMAQAQKHWIQALLNEDTYVPFPYFYDVSGWSNPLLFNVAGGRSGAVLTPVAQLVPPLAEPPAPALPANRPSVAVFRPSSSTAARESEGWLRYLLEQRVGLPYTSVAAGDIESGALDDVDVLLVPNGNAEVASNALGQRGRRALASWVEDGGRYVGWRGGAEVAARVGITSAQLAAPKSDVAGALLRVRIASGSPLAAGVGPFGWVFYDYDLVMQASDPSHVAFSYPAGRTRRLLRLGVRARRRGARRHGRGDRRAVRHGRVVLLASDPNYRAWTVGMQKVLRNAILGPDPATAGRRGLAGAEVERDQGGELAALARLPDPAHRDGRHSCGRRGGAGCTGADVLRQGHGQQSPVPHRQPGRADRRGAPVRGPPPGRAAAGGRGGGRAPGAVDLGTAMAPRRPPPGARRRGHLRRPRRRRANRISPSSAYARIVSPSPNSPSSRRSASGFSRSRWIARFSGRAP